jgi:hypothetical protein
MPKSRNPKLFVGVHARLVFLKEEDERAVLDLMRRFSGATRIVCNTLEAGRYCQWMSSRTRSTFSTSCIEHSDTLLKIAEVDLFSSL